MYLEKFAFYAGQSCMGLRFSYYLISLNCSPGGSSAPRQHAGLLPESLIWSYVVQLSSSLRAIHAAGLSCRSLDPSKIIVYGKSR